MPGPLDGKRIVLGVTGSIACYKAADLASKLTQAGALVDVLLTSSAARFISSLTFASLTHRPVFTDLFDPQSELSMDHVAVAEAADIVVVAPATAHTIAKISGGLADDVLTTTVLATRAPVLLAPAMDANMYESPATQENVAKLESRGCMIAGPAEGRLASGLIGKGRMLEVQELIGHIRAMLGRKGDLAGRKIVVSAGGTREPVDPVRVIANRSTGKMGCAVAEAARDRGATTTVVSAATGLPDPVGVELMRAETALEMQEAVLRACRGADALIMAAAVADWRPASAASRKVKKGNSETWSIDLVKNPDILSEASGDRLVKVGFAAESEDLIANAESKLVGKGLHLIAANDITAEDGGFGSDNNTVTLLDREGGVEELPAMSKYDVANRILDRVAALLR
jgi:phosphopantothenoylcysteine decarboxylase/phosphopantothenate--cysteine ligase